MRKRNSETHRITRGIFLKDLLIFTPVNPTRPFYEQLGELHRLNVEDSIFYCKSKFKDYGVNYVEKECLLPASMQNRGLYRGQNVIKNFNKIFKSQGAEYRYICKWDDDLLLPPTVLWNTLNLIEKEQAVGAGILQENYGAPNILMVNPRKNGFIGSFQRFYIYKTKVWKAIPVVMGQASGDPDQPFQRTIKGKKIVVNCPNVHIDHRACFLGKKTNEALYKVMLDLAYFSYTSI